MYMKYNEVIALKIHPFNVLHQIQATGKEYILIVLPTSSIIKPVQTKELCNNINSEIVNVRFFDGKPHSLRLLIAVRDDYLF